MSLKIIIFWALVTAETILLILWAIQNKYISNKLKQATRNFYNHDATDYNKEYKIYEAIIEIIKDIKYTNLIFVNHISIIIIIIAGTIAVFIQLSN